MATSISNQGANGLPEPVARVGELMSGFPARWALCGGWAVDAWLGRETREHGDIDVSVFADDQRALFEHLAGWQLLAHGTAWQPTDTETWWDGRPPLPPQSHIHARPPDRSGPMPEGGIATREHGFELEFQIDELSGEEWVLSREPRLALPLRDAVRESPWGVPAAVPEVLLFFKAGGPGGPEAGWLRRRDKLDFHALLPHLPDEQRAWLREAIALLGHPWLARLSR